jgi:hypothetical protein
VDRTCSNLPLLSHPPRSLDAPPIADRPTPKLPTKLMSPKKHHEISRFLDYLSYLDLGIGSVVRHAIDLGAGRGYLSRALAGRILGLDVLAVDYKDELTQDARGLLSRTTMPMGEDEERRGTLEHVTAFLDRDSVLALLENWNGDRDKLLVALHACGDLTVEVLRAVVADTLQSPPGRRNALVCVGCCYNRMDTSKSRACCGGLRSPFKSHTALSSGFPLSETVSALRPSPNLTHEHLQLATQSPKHWPAPSEDDGAMRKLALRGRLEAELRTSGIERAADQRVGRIRSKKQSETWQSFRSAALARLRDFQNVRELQVDEDEWEVMAWKVAVFWTLRSLLGPVIESLIVLDRYLFLVEQLDGTGRSVEWVNLFEQASGSLRNVALVVR